jgi:hypothetical protein
LLPVIISPGHPVMPGNGSFAVRLYPMINAETDRSAKSAGGSAFSYLIHASCCYLAVDGG